jgi:hypothetical protein
MGNIVVFGKTNGCFFPSGINYFDLVFSAATNERFGIETANETAS